MHVKKIIFISISIFLVVSIAFNVVGKLQQRKLKSSYNELEIRYSAIEDSNRTIYGINNSLRINNNELRAEQRRTDELLGSARGIITEFEIRIGETENTITRIEDGIDTLERIIGVLFEEIE